MKRATRRPRFRPASARARWCKLELFRRESLTIQIENHWKVVRVVPNALQFPRSHVAALGQGLRRAYGLTFERPSGELVMPRTFPGFMASGRIMSRLPSG